MNKPTRTWVVLGLIVLAASIALNVYHMAHRPAKDGAAVTAGAEKWQCPMHPTIVQDHPGDCPICGMKLVKMSGAGAASAASMAMISESAAKVPAAMPVTATNAGKTMYTCPMDPQIMQDHPGKCPICGMNLVPAKTAPKSAAKAESGAVKYQCPMHPTIVQDHPGDCPICGMKLVKMEPAKSTAPASEHTIAYYRSPMDPKITSPTPQKDEMGMDFIPVYSDEAAGIATPVANRAAVTIDPARQQLIGLRTATVTESEIRGGWTTVGRVAVDPTRVSAVNLKVGGYVEQVFADFVGKPIEMGAPLFSLYSPDLYAAEQEYLLALKSRETLLKNGGDQADGDALVETVRQKLRLWDVSSPQIKALQESGKPSRIVTFTAPAGGVITAKNIVAGSSVMPGEIAFEITDLSTVWVLADAYQTDLAHLETGTPATFTAQGLGGKSFAGRVDFIDPALDPMSRTLKVRVNVTNTTGELKPDLFGEVTFAGASHTALVIPADAVIPTGQDNFVFVSRGEGRFEPRRISLGARDENGHVEVTGGLMAGEEVVTRANFLIDSESSLRAALAAVGN